MKETKFGADVVCNPGTVAWVGEQAIKPDPTNGISQWVTVQELIDLDRQLQLGNGGGWCRRDSRGILGRKYNVEFRKEKNKIIAIRFNGYRQAPPTFTNISFAVREALRNQSDVVLAISTDEVDHKDGHDSSGKTSDDFQKMGKAVNDAKRTHCKRCKDSGKRFDARVLGYKVSQIEGDAHYDPFQGCRGCYWHDPQYWNRTISAGFKKS